MYGSTWDVYAEELKAWEEAHGLHVSNQGGDLNVSEASPPDTAQNSTANAIDPSISAFLAFEKKMNKTKGTGEST